MLRFTDPLDEMDRMMSSFGGRWRGGIMPMDAYEKDGVYKLRFDLPGVDPEQVDLTIEGNVLTVTAERPVEDEEGASWMLRERPAGTHSREVRLGDRLDGSRVEANFDNGVLMVTIPMKEETHPKKVSISAKTPGGIGSGTSS